MKIHAICVAVFVLSLVTPPHAIAANPKVKAADTTTECDASSMKTSSLPWAPNKLENSQEVKKAVDAFVTQLVANFEDLKTTNKGVAPSIKDAIGGNTVTISDALILAAVTGSYPTTTTLPALSDDVQKRCAATSTTGNTNKQTGAPAAAEGTTSTTELTGIPELLSVAVENGAVTNSVNGSTMTLSTSIYGALKGFGLTPDSSHAYESCSFCVQTGGSATFNIADNSDPLASATRKQVSQWQLKYSFRDQSNRSSKVGKLWPQTSASAFAAAAQPNHEAAHDAAKELKDLFVQYVEALDGLALCIDAISAANTTTSTKSATCSLVTGTPTDDGLATAILQGLDSNNAFQTTLAHTQTNSDLKEWAEKFQKVQDSYNAGVKKFEADVDNLSKGFNADITFGQQFPTTAATSSTSSTTRSVIAQVGRANATATSASTHIPDYLVGGLDLSWQPKTTTDASTATPPVRTAPSLTFNAKTSFYTNPNLALNEKTFRGGTAAFQAQWTLGVSPFVSDPNDKSKMTLAASGSYQRLQENKDQAGKRPDIALGSIKLTIPFPGGISFPVALTVGSAQQQQAKGTYVVGNFGLSFDADKLAALLAVKH